MRPDFVNFASLSVRYGEGPSAVHALEDADLAFPEGSFVCIVGPSGCGKTTLMQTLAGFLAPTSGTVSLDGRVVTGPGPERGVVFQQPALFPWMSVAANAGFGPRMRHDPGGQERVQRWLRTVGLWEFRDRYPYELSGGMQQRLAIARALCNEPKVLLMDEPFGALDALTRERAQELILRVWDRSGKSVLLITHSVEEALFMGTRLIVMSPRPGRITHSFDLTFSRLFLAGQTARAVKASPDFITLREKVLELIFADEEAS